MEESRAEEDISDDIIYEQSNKIIFNDVTDRAGDRIYIRLSKDNSEGNPAQQYNCTGRRFYILDSDIDSSILHNAEQEFGADKGILYRRGIIRNGAIFDITEQICSKNIGDGNRCHIESINFSAEGYFLSN